METTSTAEILHFAKELYHVEDGRLVQRLSTDEYAKCGERVEPDAKLLFNANSLLLIRSSDFVYLLSG